MADAFWPRNRAAVGAIDVAIRELDVRVGIIYEDHEAQPIAIRAVKQWTEYVALWKKLRVALASSAYSPADKQKHFDEMAQSYVRHVGIWSQIEATPRDGAPARPAPRSPSKSI